MSHRLSWRCTLLVTLSLLVPACRSSPPPAWLAERARQEVELAVSAHVTHDFRFTDQRRASGITFQKTSVANAARTLKQAPYGPRRAACAAEPAGGARPAL